MIRAKNHSHHVRHEKSHISNRPAHRNSEARECGRRDVNDQAHTTNIHAEVHRFLLSREEKIQIGRSCVDDRSRC